MGWAADNLWSLSEGGGKDNDLAPSLLKAQCWCYNAELIRPKPWLANSPFYTLYSTRVVFLSLSPALNSILQTYLSGKGAL